MNENLENLITQSLDGLLSPEQQAELDAELARDPAARALRDEYAALDAALKSAPLPNLNFTRLNQRISDAIAESDAPITYKFPAWARLAGGIAAAACIIFAFGVWGHFSRPVPVAVSPATSTRGITQVAIMNAGSPVNLQPIASISIGPQPGLGRIDLPAREALTAGRSSVAIDSAAPPAQDTERTLY